MYINQHKYQTTQNIIYDDIINLQMDDDFFHANNSIGQRQ